jgi:hypothetical protein
LSYSIVIGRDGAFSLECGYAILYKKWRISFTAERERNGQLCKARLAFRAESMNISILIAGRRGARGKRGHKGAVMQRNISSVSEANQSYSKANTNRRRRKRSAIETEEPRPLRLRLRHVNEPKNSAIKVFDRQPARSLNRPKMEHARYVVELVGHQTMRFEKEAGWQERRRIREKEALKATKEKLQKRSLESGGQKAERLEKEDLRSLKKDDLSYAEPPALHLKKRARRSRKR